MLPYRGVSCTPLKQVYITIKGFIMASDWYYSEHCNFELLTAELLFTLVGDKATSNYSFSMYRATISVTAACQCDSATMDM